MTATIQIGQIMDVEQGTIEDVATIEAAIARPPMGVVEVDTTMITATATIGAITTAMDTAVEAAIVAAEEAYTLAV